MRITFTILLGLISLSLAGQNMPILSKTTATWCPRCGGWGWSYMEEMKDEFDDGSAMVLGVHYLGSSLENETAVWWAENLGSVGQPQFFLNHENLGVSSGNWEDKIAAAQEAKTEVLNQTLDVLSVSSLDVNNNVLDVEVNVGILSVVDAYLNVYIFEDKVEANQSGGVADDIHPNVLRASMSDTQEGISITTDGYFTFSKELDADWNQDEIGILLVLWKKDGDDFIIRSSQGLSNVLSRVSVEDKLDAEKFEIQQFESSVRVIADNIGSYSVNLTSMSGHLIESRNFDQAAELSTSELVSGQYILTILSEDQYLTKKVFINN